jgi:TonB-linked SusC/RagA family outer membrane protein
MQKIVSLITVFLFTCVLAFGQGKVVSGTVRDTNGDAVPYATISEVGARNVAKADDRGNFTMKTKTAAGKLSISATGHVAMTVDGEAGMAVVMKLSSATTDLSTVVITTGIVKKASKSSGTSIQVVSGKELNQASVVNPATGLAGKVAGLNIQIADAGVNPQVRVTLRGNRSILGNNQALIVVDGNIVDNNFLARINPVDIENQTILKGAGAAAIYGSQASNGVLVITTKRGNNQKPRIVVSSTTQFETISYMPKLQERYGSFGGEDINSQPEGLVLFPNDPNPGYYAYENQSYGPEYNGQMVPLGMPVRIFRPDGTFYYSQKEVPYAPVKNGKYNFFDKGVTTQNSISYSAGNDNSNLYFSYQNVTVKGVVPEDKSDRHSIRINGQKVYGKFKIDFNSNLTAEKIDQAGGAYTQGRPVYWMVINQPQHANLRDFRNWRTDPYASLDGYYNQYYGNPWWQIDAARNVTKSTFLTTNIKLDYKVLPWLNVNYTVGYSRRDFNFKGQSEGYQFADWAIADECHCGGIASGIRKLESTFNEQLFNRQRLNGDLTITMEKQFGNFNTKVLLGSTAWKTLDRSISASASALVFPGIYNLGNRIGEPIASNFTSEEALIGQFVDATIGFKDYLFLHGSVRRDQTSLLSAANRTFTYPAVDVAFVLSDAIPALKDAKKFLSFAKVRAGYAKVGQLSVGPYSVDNTIVTGGGFPYGGTVGFTVPGTTNNPLLKPEFTTEREVGVELGFWKGRINVNATYYNTTTTNQTIPRQISAASGYTTATSNLGSMTNKGIELDLRLTPFLNLGGVKWNVSANYTYNKNAVGNDLPGEISLGNSVFAIPGQPYPYLKGQDWQRDPEGRIVVNSVDGYPIRGNGTVPFGTTVAPTRVGITSSWVYKNITLNVVADARFGGIILNDIGSDLDFTGISWYSAQTGRTPFVVPNSVYLDAATNKFVPNTSIATKDANNGFWANHWNQPDAPYVNSADYWKIREIALTYSFPKTLFKQSKGIQAVDFTINARNFFMFRPKDNVWTDPEFSNAGTGNAVGLTNINQTPPTRIFGATLNVTF